MPQNKRESLIYTVMMCFVMVLWMSFYNVALQQGRFTLETLAAGWARFPLRLRGGHVLRLVRGLQDRQGRGVPLSGQASGQRAEKDPVHLLRHGGGDGGAHVPLRGLRGRVPHRQLGGRAGELAGEHPPQLHHGAAPSAAAGRPLVRRCSAPPSPRERCWPDFSRQNGPGGFASGAVSFTRRARRCGSAR